MKRKTLARAVLGATIALGVCSGRVCGQTSQDSSFERVQTKLRIGDTVFVVDATGREQKGTVLDLSPEALSLAINGKRREVTKADVQAIDIQHRDSLKNGALIGFGVGAGFTAVVCLAAAADDYTSGGEIAGIAVAGVLVYGGIGAALGTLFDALIEERLPVYRAQSKSRTQVSVAPLIARDKKGVALAVRFAP